MFKKYPSIENSYRAEFISRIKEQGFGELEYIVQEKAHGSNFSFWTDNGINFECMKRTSVILPGEKFYNYELVLEEHLLRLQNLWTDIKSSHSDMQELTVFGELIGGSYAHKAVKHVKGAIKVQKGIFYCPHNSFYGFDIMINQEQYLSVDKAAQLFKKEGIAHAETLFRGSLDECLKYPNDNQSVIYKQFDLPQIEDNVCEGVVIRPQETCFLHNGSRVIIKNKNEKWTEKQQAGKKTRKEIELSDEVKHLQEKLLEYVTENRFINVISKIGQIEQKDIGKVLSMYSNDAIEDFSKDYGNEFNALEKKDQKQVSRIISKYAVEMIKKHFKGEL